MKMASGGLREASLTSYQEIITKKPVTISVKLSGILKIVAFRKSKETLIKLRACHVPHLVEPITEVEVLNKMKINMMTSQTLNLKEFIGMIRWTSKQEKNSSLILHQNNKRTKNL